jgi:sugar (pentulose or hexulose) kinase
VGLLLGVDLGTTAIKGGLYDEGGRLLGSASREQELITPAPSVVELNLEQYWSAFVHVVHQVLDQSGYGGHDVQGVALSAQGETFVPVGRNGNALRPPVVWLDNRATSESEQLANKFGAQTIYEVTGQTEMLPTWPAAKILWLRAHEPEVYEAVSKWLLLEDYFLYRMTGELVCEPSLVTSTCYFECRARRWWPDMLEALGLEQEQLPVIREPGTAVGPFRPEVADELRLDRAAIVSLGGLDQACGALGVGNVRPGVFSENTGAALAICSTVNGPVLDPLRRIPCHCHGVPGEYMLHTFTSGGIVLKWWRDRFFQRDPRGEGDPEIGYDWVTPVAEPVPPGSEGLLCVPHLQGAMAPDPNPYATGAIVGLTLRHGAEHVVRAILEGVAYVVRRNVEAIRSMGVSVSEIRALGGAARSPLWKQIEADVTGLPVVVTTCAEPATLGAAMLAGVGAGIYESVVAAVETTVEISARHEPRLSVQAVYDDGYDRYCQVTSVLGELAMRQQGSPDAA